MNQNKFSLIVFASVLLMVAVGIPTAKAAAADEAPFRAEPIFTRHARTTSHITLNGSVSYFKDAELQEADQFDGFTSDIELVVPFLDRFQFRLYYPIYTDGQARLIDTNSPVVGKDIDISGNGGTFDFPSAILDFEFIKPKRPGGWSFAAFGGYGRVFHPLDTTAPDLNTTSTDIYNHKGRAILFGLKANGNLSDNWTLLLNVGGRDYIESDDLHPRGKDVFWLWDARAAITYNTLHKRIIPAAELVFQGDFSDYNSISLVPEVIVPVCPHFDIKAAVPIGLGGDGQRWGATIQIAVKF